MKREVNIVELIMSLAVIFLAAVDILLGKMIYDIRSSFEYTEAAFNMATNIYHYISYDGIEGIGECTLSKVKDVSGNVITVCENGDNKFPLISYEKATKKQKLDYVGEQRSIMDGYCMIIGISMILFSISIAAIGIALVKGKFSYDNLTKPL